MSRKKLKETLQTRPSTMVRGRKSFTKEKTMQTDTRQIIYYVENTIQT